MQSFLTIQLFNYLTIQLYPEPSKELGREKEEFMFFDYVYERGIKNISKQEWQVLFLFFFNDDNKTIGFMPDDAEYIAQRFDLPSETKIINLCNHNSFLINRLNRDNYNLSQGFQFILDYVTRNGFLLISKTEWQRITFYAFVTSYTNNSLTLLSTGDIFDIADRLNISYEEVTRLIKTCYSLEGIFVVESLTDFFNRGLSPNVEFGSDSIKLEVINPLALESLKRLLIRNGVVQDSSFNKNIVKISTEALHRLIDGKPVRSMPDIIRQIIRRFTSIDGFDNKYDEFIRQYGEFRNREAFDECKKLVFKFLSNVLTSKIDIHVFHQMLSTIFNLN